MKFTFYLSFFLISNVVCAQTFQAEAVVPVVEKAGFYRILIEPKATSIANEYFSNFRLIDNDNIEVPYILSVESPSFSATEFQEYELVSKDIQSGCCTKLLLRNHRQLPIRNISLIIKNADTHKNATLLGSDDKITWYALKENFYFDAINNPDQTFEVRILDFPLASYEFLSITIDDSTSAPLNIVKAGYYETQSTFNKLQPIPGLKFSQSENRTQKQSLVSIRFDSAQLIDKLSFIISGQPFYHRQATLYEKATRKNRKGKLENYNRFLRNMELTSTHEATLTLNAGKLKDLLLIVENGDNPILNFTLVNALQQNRYITAWLEPEEKYSLKIGAGDLSAPVYDLDYFKDKIPNQPPVLSLTGFLFLEAKSNNHTTSVFKKEYIWSAIGLVSLVLGYMSWKMIQEKQEKSKN